MQCSKLYNVETIAPLQMRALHQSSRSIVDKFYFFMAEGLKVLRWLLTKHIQGQGLEFDTKYQILHYFRSSSPFNEKSPDHFKDCHKFKLLTNFGVNLTSFQGGITDNNLSKFETPRADEVKMTSKFVRNFSL